MALVVSKEMADLLTEVEREGRRVTLPGVDRDGYALIGHLTALEVATYGIDPTLTKLLRESVSYVFGQLAAQGSPWLAHCSALATAIVGDEADAVAKVLGHKGDEDAQ